MFAKKILLITTLCCFVFSLSACTGKKESSNMDLNTAADKATDSNTGSMELSPALNSERVKIHFQVLFEEAVSTYPAYKPYMDAVADFNRLHPDIEVIIDYTSPNAFEERIHRLETDQAPDIVPLFPRDIKAVEGKGLLRDLQPLQSEELDIPVQILDLGAIDGELLMLPFAAFPQIVYYNKVLFDKANVPYPAGDWTWDQFRDISRQMKDYPSILPYNLYTLDFLLVSTGNGVLSPDGSTSIGYLDSTAAIERIQWLNGWYREQNRSKPLDSPEQYNQFSHSKFGMVVDGMSRLTYVETETPNIGAAPLPYLAGGQRVNPYVGFTGYGISQRSKHPEEAWQFIHYLTLEKNEHSLQLAKGYTPTSKAMAEASGVSQDPIRSVFYEELKYAGQSSSANNPLFWPAFNVNLENRFKELLTTSDEDIPHKLHEIAVKVDAEMNRLKLKSEKPTESASQ